MYNNLIMMNDLNKLHGLPFLATEKDNKEAQINNVRMMISNNQIVINPRCKHLIYHVKGASWKEGNSVNRIFSELSDTPDHSIRGGHADALDALIYLVRNIVRSKNPYPKNWGLPQGEDIFVGYHQLASLEKRNSDLVKTIKQIMNIED